LDSLILNWQDNGNISADAVRDACIQALSEVIDEDVDTIIAMVDRRLECKQWKKAEAEDPRLFFTYISGRGRVCLSSRSVTCQSLLKEDTIPNGSIGQGGLAARNCWFFSVS